MSKVTFAKLGLTKNAATATVTINDQQIEVKQYLPIEEKLQLIADVLNDVQDNNNFVNYLKLKAYTRLHMIFKYSNITFTEKQKEDKAKLYDLLESNDVMQKIVQAIPQAEANLIENAVVNIADHMYEYRNSVYGILDAMKEDYSNLEFDATKIRDELADPNNLTFLKGVIDNLG